VKRSEKTTIVLSLRALPQPEAHVVDSLLGIPNRKVSAIGLRDLGAWGAMKRLWSLRGDRTVIAGTTLELSSFADLLGVIALVTCARRFDYLNVETCSLRRLRLFRLIAGCFRLGVATFEAKMALMLAGIALARYERSSFRPNPVSTRTRHVLYLRPGPFTNHKVGGSIAHVAGVANAIVRGGYGVTLLAAAPQPELDASVNQVVVAPSERWGLPIEANSVRYVRRFVNAAQTVIRQVGPAFIYKRYSPNDLSGLELRQRSGIPLVIEYNGSEVWTQRNWGTPMRLESLALRIERAVLLGSDLVVTVSDALVSELLSNGVPSERILFYPNGIDPIKFDPSRFNSTMIRGVRNQFDIEANATLLTFVGTFGRWHGTDVLADAIRTLIDQDRQALRRFVARFLFVGDGHYYDRVVQRLSRSGDDEFVRLVGARPQSETPITLAASDILLSPHRQNDDGSPFFGSPTKFFEYMAMAKPIVVSDLDQLGQVARGWTPGSQPVPPSSSTAFAILVEPNSVESLRAGILQALATPIEQREEMGRAARRAVLRGFTWDANVAAVLSRLGLGTVQPDSAS
jgi:glycosyltransferase involved in cell wall biosynthesis